MDAIAATVTRYYDIIPPETMPADLEDHLRGPKRFAMNKATSNGLRGALLKHSSANNAFYAVLDGAHGQFLVFEGLLK